MITCRTVVLRLWKLTDDVEPAKHRRPLEQHINDCPACQAYLDGYRLTILLTRRLHCPPLPKRLARRLEEMLAAERGKGDARPLT
jgi:Putative zinc-finger